MRKRYLPPGLELLCDMEMRKTWFEDAKELQKGNGEPNPFHDVEHDDHTLSECADAVIICGNAAEEAEERGAEDLSNMLYDMACMAMVAYLAILWDTALPEDMGGSQDIDHPKANEDIDVYQLGLDTMGKREWLKVTKDAVERGGLAKVAGLSETTTRLIAVCGQWWAFMWDEIKDMEARG
jgi:hypothetical protein